MIKATLSTIKCPRLKINKVVYRVDNPPPPPPMDGIRVVIESDCLVIREISGIWGENSSFTPGDGQVDGWTKRTLYIGADGVVSTTPQVRIAGYYYSVKKRCRSDSVRVEHHVERYRNWLAGEVYAVDHVSYSGEVVVTGGLVYSGLKKAIDGYGKPKKGRMVLVALPAYYVSWITPKCGNCIYKSIRYSDDREGTERYAAMLARDKQTRKVTCGTTSGSVPRGLLKRKIKEEVNRYEYNRYRMTVYVDGGEWKESKITKKGVRDETATVRKAGRHRYSKRQIR